MPQAIIYLNEKNNSKVEKIADKHNISKYDAIIRIIEEHKENPNEKEN